MALFLPTPFFYILTISILISTLPSCSTANDIDELQLKQLNHEPMQEKLCHFRLYWHDIQSGHAPTSIVIIKSPPNATLGFGKVNMIDNPLTLGPQLSSKTVGRAQGFYALASQEEVGILMTMNFFFTYGKFNGSTIAILGRNPNSDHVREMPVVGGSGMFRYARGYAQAQTHTFDMKTGDATVEYNVYVMHY